MICSMLWHIVRNESKKCHKILSSKWATERIPWKFSYFTTIFVRVHRRCCLLDRSRQCAIVGNDDKYTRIEQIITYREMTFSSSLNTICVSDLFSLEVDKEKCTTLILRCWMYEASKVSTQHYRFVQCLTRFMLINSSYSVIVFTPMKL